MDKEILVLICLTLIALGAIIGFFLTKTSGWGTYSSSTLILILALSISAILLALGKLDGPSFGNAMFAIIGYAGGLIVGNKAA